jgi:hypothetical protein
VEISDTAFLLIIVGYVIGGLVCLGVAATGFGGSNRIVTGLIGVAAIVYAGYLFFAPTDSVWVFPYLLLVPVIVLFQAFRNRSGNPQRV